MATTAQTGLTPEFAAGFRQVMLDGVTRELETTKKVLAAIPDAKAQYQPDPHARTAWDLAWHLANTDVQFLDGIADLEFKMETPEEKDKPKTVAELVDWYDKNFKRAADRVRAHDAATVDYSGRVFRRVQLPGGFLSWVPQQSQHPSSRTTGNLSAPDGGKVPIHLRRQLRRAVPGRPSGDQRRLMVFEANCEAAPRGGFFLRN